jgi:hypothetical protein
MPPSQQRVVDYLNRSQAFVPVHDGTRLHLVHKAHVTRVLEIAEDQ